MMANAMDSVAVAASNIEIEEFINGALVSWVESCLSRPETLCGYVSLLDGQIIHNVWLQIDPEPMHHPMEINDLSGLSLCIARTRNFDVIVRNLKQLFEEELKQIILQLPDCFVLGYYPESKQGLEEMRLLLTLLLGAAVQCPNKAIFITRIKELDEHLQHEIMDLIKQVTDNDNVVLSKEFVDAINHRTMYNHILRLTKERDCNYMKWMAAVCKEETDLNRTTSMECVSVPGSSSVLLVPPAFSLSPSSKPEMNHLAVELADMKSKLRKLRQELEEKTEGQLELREELGRKTAQYEKLRLESQAWYNEAKRADFYRDEMDVLKEQAERADHLEMDVRKLKEKLTDAEFYKCRMEELLEDNRMLLETKDMLEEQLQRWRKRSEHVITLESEIISYKQKLNDMALERNADHSKMEELMEENTQLQLAAKNTKTTPPISKSLFNFEEEHKSGDGNLSEQLTNDAQTRVLKLELENHRLAAALDKLNESCFHESATKILELEKEKKKCSIKIEQMEENIQRLLQQNSELENLFKNALEENKKMQDILDQRQRSYDKQSQEREIERSKMIELEKSVEALRKEKQHIQTLNESIQRRADSLERTLDLRNKEIEQHGHKMELYEKVKEELYDLQGKLNTHERENSSLVKEVAKLKTLLEEKSVQLDERNIQVESNIKEINRLLKVTEDTKKTEVHITELEREKQELLSQRKIDLETIATLRSDLVNGTLATNKVRHNLEKLGLTVYPAEENNELNVEAVVEKLVRNPETFKTVREIILNVYKHQKCNENDAKSDICVLCHRKGIYTVEKNIELSSDNNLNYQPQCLEQKLLLTPIKLESLELNRLSDANTQLSALNNALQINYDQLQADNARFKVDVATLGSQITSLNTQHVALQLANSQLAADKDALLKENEALKQEHQNLIRDQVTLQRIHDQLSIEYESINKNREDLKAELRDERNKTRELKDSKISLDKQIANLERDNTLIKASAEDLAILRTEHSKLTDDFRNLFARSDRFKNEYKNIQEKYKLIRKENGKLKLQNTELNGDLNGRNDRIKMLEIHCSKAEQHCEMLIQQNVDLDGERKKLMENVSHLLKQYHELLTLSLEDKQHFHQEEKTYTESVHNLHRQKEKLEEKIIELFKKSESTVAKKKPPFASNFVKRVKKASTDLINKVPTRNRKSWTDDVLIRPSQSQMIAGIESGGNDSDNSTEDHYVTSSVVEAAHFLHRNNFLQQQTGTCLAQQRDSLEISTVCTEIRNSTNIQIQQTDDVSLVPCKSNIPCFEAPDITGSSLTLATAGSRRTVYLVEESQQTKISDTNSSQLDTTGISVRSSSSSSTSTLDAVNNSSNETTTPTNSTANTRHKTDQGSTYLIYNRINTMIGGGTGCSSSGSYVGGSSGVGSALNLSSNSDSNNSCVTLSNNNHDQNNRLDDSKVSRRRSDDKSNSVWYEYGCV